MELEEGFGSVLYKTVDKESAGIISGVWCEIERTRPLPFGVE